MADYSDFKNKNTKFTGVIGERISKGTTAERDVNSYGAGTFRFNTTLSLLEYYDGVIWKSIDAPPAINSISPVGWASDGSTIATITVTGSNFSVGATVTFVGADNTEYNSTSVTRNSITELTATTVASMGTANEPYSVKVTNNSGLSATLSDALDAGAAPGFLVGAGTLGTLRAGNLNGSALSTFGNSYDADSTSVSYTVTAGSLPSGLSLGTGAAAGTITGTAASVSTETTDTFTITGTDGFNTNSRQFSITRAAPQYASYTSTGAFNWTIPSGVTGVGLLLVAGGGGGAFIGGGAGGGGVVEGLGYDISPYVPGGSVPGSLGAGGPNAPGSAHNNQGSWNGRGANTVFGAVTAIGGGSTSGWNQPLGGGSDWTYGPGGSGGGGTGGDSGGTATQPTQPGFSGGSNAHGFPGAAGGNHPSNPQATNGQTGAGTHSGGGGGGAGSAGGHPNQNGPGDTRTTQQAGRYGGYGYTSNYSGSSVTYAGGGAGSSHNGGYNIGTIPGSPGGGGSAPPGGGQSGTANRGGGGAGGHYPDSNGGNGGSGFVSIIY